MTSTDLERFTGFLDVRTGEVLEPTIANAAQALDSCRAMKTQADDLIKEITAWAVEQSQERGTKTLHALDASLTVSGGPTVDYDPEKLMEALEVAGCPQDRIIAAVQPTVTYKVNRAVLNQLVAANPDYKAAAELARVDVEKPYRASIKLRRREDG